MNNENRPQIQPLPANATFEQASANHQPHGAELVDKSAATKSAAETALDLVAEARDAKAFRAGLDYLSAAAAADKISPAYAREVLQTIGGHEQFMTPTITEKVNEIRGNGTPDEQNARIERIAALDKSIGYKDSQEALAAAFLDAQRQVKEIWRQQATPAEIRHNKLQELSKIHPAFLTTAERAELAGGPPKQESKSTTADDAYPPKAGPFPYGLRQVPATRKPGYLEAIKGFTPDQTEAFGARLDEVLAPSADETHVFPAIQGEIIEEDSNDAHIPDVEVIDQKWAKLGEYHDEEARREANGDRALIKDAKYGGVRRRDGTREPEEEGEVVPLQPRRLRDIGRRAIVAGQMKLMDLGKQVDSGAHGEKLSPGKRVAIGMLGLAAVSAGSLLVRYGLLDSVQDTINNIPDPSMIAQGPPHEAVPTLPPVEEIPIEPPANPEKTVHHISTAAREVVPGETIERTLKQLGVPENKWDDIVDSKKVGRIMQDNGDAYRLPDGSYGLSIGDGELSNASINAIYDKAGMDAADAKIKTLPSELPAAFDTAAERHDLIEQGGLNSQGQNLLEEFASSGRSAIIEVAPGDGFAQIAQRYGLNEDQLRILKKIAASQPYATYREAGELRLNPTALRLSPAQITRILKEG